MTRRLLAFILHFTEHFENDTLINLNAITGRYLILKAASSVDGASKRNLSTQIRKRYKRKFITIALICLIGKSDITKHIMTQ